MANFHTPVMVREVLNFLNIKKDNWYIDCNLGGGGHSSEIIKKGGNVLGIDLDINAINFAQDNLLVFKDNFIFVNDNFKNIKEIVKDYQLKEVAGILFDLGVSTYQLETKGRGFSFNLDAALDMRMDPQNQKVSAQDLINGLHENELAQLFWKLGEERFAKRIAKKIVEKRQNKKIENTSELAQIIVSARPKTSHDRTHPATRVFQALRIAVNDELNSLRQALPEALGVLDKGGRMVVISFHSLEDRIVKNYFRQWEKQGLVTILTKKPVTPTNEEVFKNPRARSGKLRVIEKV